MREGRSELPQKWGEFPAELIREDLREFTGYSSARTSDPTSDNDTSESIWLNANEAAGSSPADPDGANRRYPEPQPEDLVAALADAYGVRAEQVVVGRGSDEGIDLLVRTLCRPGSDDGVVQSPPTFGMYAVSARLHGVPVLEVPQRDLGQLWDVDVAAVRDRTLDHGGTLVFLASPGNPTGAVLPLQEVADLATALDGRAVLVIDEAYQEFATQPSAATLLGQHPNLVVLRTLSKAHGLAGVRVGALLCHPDLAKVLRRVQAPYPLAVPVTELAVRALARSVRRSVDTRVAQTRAGREHLAELLGADPRVSTVYASEANFVLLRSPEVDSLLADLRASGIVVRDMRPLLEDALRVTVGTPKEIDAVRSALRTVPAPAPDADLSSLSITTPARGTHP